MNKSKGFTLIELLVVIAIIGILSSVVLASLNSARAKGGDAAVKANLNGIRQQAELYYDNASPNSYGVQATTTATQAAPTTCAGGVFSDATVQKAVQAAIRAGGSATTYCGATTNAYGIIVPLKTDTTRGWCVDSSGNGIERTMPANAAAFIGC